MPTKVSPTRPTSAAAPNAATDQRASGVPQDIVTELRGLAPGRLREIERLRLSPFLNGRTEVRSLPGVRARVASGIGTSTVTLSRARDAGLFRAGEVVRALQYPESDVARTGSGTLSAVDETNGTLTIGAGTWSGAITGLANGDFLILADDVDARELRIAHMIGRTPVGAIVIAGELVALGMSPELDTVAADSKFLTLRSRVAVRRASLFIL
jgi:hypothetical protein